MTTHKQSDEYKIELSIYKTATSIARLLAQTNHLPTALEKMIGLFINLVAANEGAIQMLKPASKSTRCTLVRQDIGKGNLLDKHLDDFLTGYVLESDRPVLENDLPNLLSIKNLPRHYQEIRSVLGAPLKSTKETIGVINLIRNKKSEPFTENDLQTIATLAAQVGDFLENAEIRQNLFNENIRLQKNLENKYAIHGIIGKSEKFKEVYHMLEQVIPTSARVMILGESGTGKELIARCIHYAGPRKEKPFVAVDCGALPPNLLESELFGYVRGAFTGALHDRCGLIEEADGGTLFLDEITNMSVETQAKLLRFIQEEEIRPVGSNQIKKVDVRIVVAASGDLTEEIAPAKIREDLYYRLNVISIRVPALRERIEDIPELAAIFLDRFSKKHGKSLKIIAPEALQCLEKYPWPGNVRELENMIERGVVMSDYKTRILQPIHFSTDLKGRQVVPHHSSISNFDQIMSDYERKILEDALFEHKGNQVATAKALKISESGLRYKLKRLNLKGSG